MEFLFFVISSPIISAKLPIRPNDAVAWNFEIKIFAQNISNGSIRPLPPCFFCHFFIGHHLPFRNSLHHIIYFFRKRLFHKIKESHSERSEESHYLRRINFEKYLSKRFDLEKIENPKCPPFFRSKKFERVFFANRLTGPKATMSSSSA